ncbi:MAG: DUF4159 domain-containing protein [Candidatus Latescibacterota bacterium]|nr:DUF4159 domain-containing protein [Candidatus Latescibacterota bacterium]
MNPRGEPTHPSLFLVLGLSMALASGAWSATMYVTQAGSDESDCSASSPCASLVRATELVASGDSLVILHVGADDAWLHKLFLTGSREPGRYRGLLVRTGGDRRDLRGFVSLATTWATDLTPSFASAALAIPNLADALTEQTGIAASVDRHVFIGSPHFLQSPFVYITAAQAFELTALELRSLGRYLREGGFVFADNALPAFEFSQAEASLRSMFKRALGNQGRLRRIPDSHTIYRCYYDFNGPPPGWEEARPRHILEGVFLEGRLVGLFADKGYVHHWAQPFGNEAQIRLGVNAVIYAMQQRMKSLQLHLVIRRP